MKRLSGSGLLVVDLQPDDPTVREDAYYLATDAGGVLHLQDGSAVGSLRVLGPVLFLCRPPARWVPAYCRACCTLSRAC